MSRRTRNPLDVPLAFTDTYGADDPGTLTVRTDDPAVVRTVRTAQVSIFDALDDAADPQLSTAPRVMPASSAVAIGRFNADVPTEYRARTAPDAPLRPTRAEAVEDERAHLDASRQPRPDLEHWCRDCEGWTEAWDDGSAEVLCACACGSGYVDRATVQRLAASPTVQT